MGQAVRAVYARSTSIGGRFIRSHDTSVPHRWSHCGVLLGDWVVEARAFNGVVLTPGHEFIERYAETRIVEYLALDPAGGERWLRGQIGKPYDYEAILGAWTRTNWQDDAAFQCAELLEMYLLMAGSLPRFRASPHVITPNLSFANLAGVASD